jgi:alkylation response protein AidB-like acyl-CoA dehydrogenase
MEFRFTPEQTEIAHTARGFLAANVTALTLQSFVKTPTTFDSALWDAMAHQLGWPGVAVPERLGGAGLGPVELAILMQETGAALAPAPLFATAALAIPAILAAATPQQQQQLLPAIIAGAPATLCFTNQHGTPGPAGVTAELQSHGTAFRLAGAAGFVPHAEAAQHLIIACRAPGSTGANAVSLIALPAAHPGIHATHHTTLDLTRPYSTVHFENIDIPPEAILGRPHESTAAFTHTLAFAAAMLAAEQLGGAERTLALSLDQAKQRKQFGRIIGSFQAIKHKLADMLLLVESARSAAYYAACTAAESPADLPEAASIARAYCSEAFSRCAADAIQIHGGMGFTWDHPAHLYFKRARASATLLGDPAYHREQVAQIMGLDEAAA